MVRRAWFSPGAVLPAFTSGMPEAVSEERTTLIGAILTVSETPAPARPIGMKATKTMFLMEGANLELWRSRGREAAAFRVAFKRRCRRISREDGHPAVVVADDLDTGKVLFEALPWTWERTRSDEKCETAWEGRAPNGARVYVWQYDGGSTYRTEPDVGAFRSLALAQAALVRWAAG